MDVWEFLGKPWSNSWTHNQGFYSCWKYKSRGPESTTATRVWCLNPEHGVWLREDFPKVANHSGCCDSPQRFPLEKLRIIFLKSLKWCCCSVSTILTCCRIFILKALEETKITKQILQPLILHRFVSVVVLGSHEGKYFLKALKIFSSTLPQLCWFKDKKGNVPVQFFKNYNNTQWLEIWSIQNEIQDRLSITGRRTSILFFFYLTIITELQLNKCSFQAMQFTIPYKIWSHSRH